MGEIFDIAQEILGYVNRKENPGRGCGMHVDWKWRSKVSLFAGDMILYVENPKEYTNRHTNTTNIINLFSKVTGYKTQYIQINCIFIY